MMKYNILQLILAVLGFGITQIFIYFFLFITTMSLFWECGNSWLDVRYEDSIRFGVLLGLALIQGIISYNFIKKNQLWVGYTAFLLNLITVVLFFANGFSCLNWNHYYQKFSETEWKAHPERPMEMVRYIIKYEILKDKSKEEVLSMLGPDEKTWSKNYGNTDFVSYYTEDNYSPLFIEFKNNKVDSYYLACFD